MASARNVSREHVGHPACASFHETPAQTREPFGEVVPQHRVEGTREHHQAAVHRVARVAAGCSQVTADVHRDREIEVLRLLVQRHHRRIGEAHPVVLPEQEHRRRTVRLAELELLHRPRHRLHRRHHGPTQAPTRLGGALGDPPVVAAVQRRLGGRAPRGIEQPPRRVHHLCVDAEVVHVAQARPDVDEVAARKHRAVPLSHQRPRPLHHVILDRPVAVVDHRPEPALVRVEVVPRLRRLDDVRVAVDVTHQDPPVWLTGYWNTDPPNMPAVPVVPGLGLLAMNSWARFSR